MMATHHTHTHKMEEMQTVNQTEVLPTIIKLQPAISKPLT